MENKVFKSSGLPIRRTVELLPEIFQTPANEKFLGATLDALVQPGTLEKTTGYIGRKYGSTYNSSDIYLDKTNTLRSAYQLEPAVVIRKDNKISELNDYIDFKNQLKFFGNSSERDDLITNSPTYTWAPPIDWDKFVNYREYFWQPVGPDTVAIEGQARDIISSYRVRTSGDTEWLFYPDGLKKNPSITLYRGQTYEFDVNSPGDPFCIRTSNVLGDQSNYNKGVTNNSIEVGKVIFVVPNDAPDMLYYQSSTKRDRIGVFRIAEVKDNTSLDVEKDILGKQSYTSSNGVVLTNGIRLKFIGRTVPAAYSLGSWIVEGVGESIRLINWEEIELPPISNPNPEVLFDNGGFDNQPFDEALSYPRSKDYVTINRASKDKNPWSRYNRWVHRSVIEYTASINGAVALIDETLRAKRPIIEFNADIQLYNHCAVAKQSVDLVDDFTTDVFSTIEGSVGYNIDGEPITEGFRILFTADTDPLIKNKIFQVKFITVQNSTNETNRRQISLVETEDSVSSAGEGLVIKRGKKYGYAMFHFDGTTWIKSQGKLAVNVPPMIDVFDSTGVSLSDITKYNTTTFAGTKIFGYKIATAGINDSELGFPLSYLNINNTGDILFEFTWDTDVFLYQDNAVSISQNVNQGFFRFNQTLSDVIYENNWKDTATEYQQAIIQTITLTENTDTVVSTACVWDQATRDKTLYFINGTQAVPATVTVSRDKKIIKFSNVLSIDDVVTVKVYTDAEPNDGYYEIPFGLERNPLNQSLTTFTLGQVNDHVGSMIELNSEFIGTFPGASNLRDLVDYEKYGRRFLKHAGVPALAINLICNKETNIINSIRFAANEYNKFRNNFLTLAIDLPYDNGDPIEFVDAILSSITKSKSLKSPFVDSDMIGSGAFSAISYTVEDTGINTFALSEKFDLETVSNKAVYVYINGNQGLVNNDYIFDSTFGFVRILTELSEGDLIEIKEYFTTSFNFIPATPTKMGLYKKYIPRIFIDDTYIEPTKVIQGHDGSITVAFNDFRDDLLLELEKRIYNNIKINYDESKFDIDATASSFYKTGSFTKKDFDYVINQEFLRWAVTTDVDLFANTFYSPSNPFTYSYPNIVDSLTGEPLPAFWRGIYSTIFDTDRPHVCPWEMLGFSEKPLWWEEEYGPAPYTSGNLLLWEDLRDGFIRQGHRVGKHIRYERPNLLDIIPVDEEGNLKNPLLINLISNYSSFSNQSKFKFGDVAPAENAWRKSPSFPFVTIFAMCLLKPFEFISSSLDRNKIKKNIIDQTVSTDTNYFVNLETYKASLESAVTPTGLFYYIRNFLKIDLKDTEVLINKLENFDINISNKIGGFVDKSQQKYLLDSKNPKSTSSSVFIPPEDYEVFFNIGSPISNITYSGVIVEKGINEWIITGYDKLNTFFEYYPVLPSNADPKIYVGGVSENFVVWEAAQFYVTGNIVKYSDSFYRAIISHTSDQTFDITRWTKITQIPLVGAIEASKRTYFDKTDLQKLSYGSVLKDVQEVVDFLLGYGAHLKDLGFVFEEFSNELESVANWETSSKEFMFWTSHNWAPGAIISLSPAAIKLKVSSTGGVADSILDSFYDYTILKSDGTKLLSTNIDVSRSYNEFSITPVDIRDGIYFARINYVLKEHAVVFNDRTMFNDVIFDKGPGYRQQRIKVLGFRTTDWDGDYTSPGFIYDNVNITAWTPFVDYKLGDIVKYREFNYVSKQAQAGVDEFDNIYWEKLDSTPTSGLVSNFDYKISQFEDFYDLDSEGLGSSQRDLARHSIGYQTRSYLQDLVEDSVSQYRIYQGFIREKGTANSIKKVFDKISSVEADAVEINEEWAFRLGQLGGIDQFNEVEFTIGKDQFKLNPQPVILNNRTIDQNTYKNYIVLSDTDYQIGNSTNSVITTKAIPEPNYGAGYVRVEDVDFVIKNFDQLIGNNIQDFKNGSLLWTTFKVSGWDILRYQITDISVVAVQALDKNTVSLVTNRPHKLSVGTIIGLTNINNLEGFFEITGVNTTIIIVNVAAGLDKEPEIDQSSFCAIGLFLPARIKTISELTQEQFSILPFGSRIWLDTNENSRWQILERQRQYNPIGISEYGVSLPASLGSASVYVPARDQTIVSNPGTQVAANDTSREAAVIVYTQSTEGLIPNQILSPVAEIASDLLGSYGTTLTVSNDGRWLLVGSPTASGIPSGYKELYNSAQTYNTGDTVLYAGKLWKAKTPITGDGSTITLATEDWEPVELHEAQPAGKNLIGTNPGYPKQGCVDIYEFTQGQWTYRHTIISPRPEAQEYFGSSIAIGKQEGIEGTSGDVTIVVKSIDSAGGITLVDAVGVSGLKNAVFENIGGTDISTPGSGATFDIIKSTPNYIVTVRNGGIRYAIGDQIKILGTQIGGTSPTNDLIITVRSIAADGEIVGSEVYTNLTGINSIVPTTEAVFNVSRVRSSYSVSIVNRGVGYIGRSVVLYGTRYYGCIKDTQTDRGVWDSNSIYYPGDVVKYPARSSSYYVVNESVESVQFVLPTDTEYWTVSGAILPTNTEYWEEVPGGTFSTLARPWAAYITSAADGNLGDLVKYKAGSSIVISGAQLGGTSPTNNLTIKVSPNLPVTTTGTLEATSAVTVATTGLLRVDMPITFSGGAGGGISVGTQYYIKEILNNTSFTIYSDINTKEIVTLTASASSSANPMKFTDNSIRNITISGTGVNGISSVGVATGSGTYSDIAGTDISQSGGGAIFQLTRAEGKYSATVNVRGTRYNIGDQIKILGEAIGGQPESYTMAITAPGSLGNKGRLYLYEFNGIGWKQLDDNDFVGIFDYTKTYPSGSIVWSNNFYWKAIEPYLGTETSEITDETPGWELTSSLNTGMLPAQSAYINDGSSLESGFVDDNSLELLNADDLYGHSVSMSSDSTILVVGAPAADSSNIANYKGVWKSFQPYLINNIVKITVGNLPVYYKLISDSSLNEPPSPSSEVWENINYLGPFDTGCAFVYRKNAAGVYQLTQTIDADTINSQDLESGDELGYTVSLNREGTLLFVSAPDADIKEKDKGAVFVFENINGTFTLLQRLESYSLDFFERFGDTISVSPTSDTLAITAGSAVASRAVTFDKGETTFDFLLTNYKDPIGVTGKVYVYNKYDSKYILSEAFDQNISIAESFGKSLTCFDDRIIVGSPTYKSEDPAFLNAVIGKVQVFKKLKDVNSWSPIREQEDSVDIALLKTLSFFDPDTQIKLGDIDIIDPFHEKILSVAEREIKFKTSFDPAMYSNGVAANETQAWYDQMVGMVWWDTSTVKWLSTNQGDVSFRLGNWNALAFGASIDVYEWVETEYLPSEWAELTLTADAFSLGISGTPLYADNSNYSVKENLDVLSGNVSSRKYYYWVKNKQTLPDNKPFRKISTATIADYIENPISSGITFAALLDKDKISFYNPTSIISGNNVSVVLQFYKNDKPITEIHREYQLLTEGISDSVPSADLENKWIDSLIGYDIAGKEVPDISLPEKFKYGILTRPRQSMFIDRNKAVQITIAYINNILLTQPFSEILDFDKLNSTEEYPVAAKRLYDQAVDTVEELTKISTSKTKPAVLKANIINGRISTVDVIDPGYGYKVAPPIKVSGSGSGAKLLAIRDKLGRITSVQVETSGSKYISASLEIRQFAVLVKTDSTVNNYWSIYSWNERAKEFYRSATQSYNTPSYWNLIDWWETGFSEKSRVSAEIPGLYAESEISIDIGKLLRIKNYGGGNWAVLERVAVEQATILNKYRLVGRYNGTLQISDSFINTETYSTGYDKTQTYDSVGFDKSSSREFRIILDSIKTDLFVGNLSPEWNKLFFANIHYAFSEQLYIDWAFKTSFVNAIHNVGNLSKKVTYKNDNLPSYQSYINEVKPYRTKIREYTSKYLNLENSNTAITDFDVPSVYNNLTNQIEPVKLTSTEIDTYPWKFWLDNYKYSITDIVLSNPGKTYKTVPIVLIEGGGGTGATAKAFISSGRVSKVILLNGGSGYTSAPTITFVGGIGTNLANSAAAIAVLGNSKARIFNMNLRFDRVSKTATFASRSNDEKFIDTEAFFGTGSQTVFNLKYPPTQDKSKISVYVKKAADTSTGQGAKLLADEYSVSLNTINVSGLSVLRGRLTVNSAPADLDKVTIIYEKNDVVLDALNRIDKYYKPKTGMLGLEKVVSRDPVTSEILDIKVDYSQLITGIDYGGVIVQGATLDVTGGWDALPWFTEGWDSVDSLNADLYIVADGTTNSFNLTSVPPTGQQINIYLKKVGNTQFERIDYPTYDEYQTDPLIEDVPPSTALMNTYVADGSTLAVTIPTEIQINDGDVLIFRPDTSDGSFAISDKNLIDAEITGGSLSGMTPYSTALGTLASEIVIDGEKFISPDQVPAPEENVPGQVLESLSIKVFHSNRSGSPAVLSRIYTGDGVTNLYDIGQAIPEINSTLIFVDKVKFVPEEDYTVEALTNQIRFLTVPLNDQIIEIFSINIGGVEILDYRDFVADGSNRFFLTAAAYPETGRIFATVDSVPVSVGFVNSKGVVNDIDKTLVEFGVAPVKDSRITIIVLSGESGQDESIVKINYQTIDVTDVDVKNYVINDFVSLLASPTSNVIVDINGYKLKSIDTVIQNYDGTNAEFAIALDPLKPVGFIVASQVKVFVNNIPLVFGIEYEFAGATNTVTVIKTLAHGDIIRAETYQDIEYEIVDNQIVLSNEYILEEGDKINIIWFDSYSSVDLIKDVRTGGKVSYPLQRDPLSISYVWVYKNGTRLTPDVDFYLDYPRSTIYLKDENTNTDEIEIISFATDIYKKPFAYEIFKDILNAHHYTRYSVTDVSLAANLNYYDTELVLTNSSDLPTPKLLLPGVISINGERIEYLSKDGNTLKDLRRGTLGTSIPSVHLTNSVVVNLSYTEKLPYKETQDRYDFVADGSSAIYNGLPFIPSKSTRLTDWYRDTIPENFGPSDQIEVFVAGRRLRKDPTMVFDNTVGSYSPVGDVSVEAEFSVDGITSAIRLTETPPAGQRITVIRRTGKVWYNKGADSITNGETLSQNTTPIAKFLQQRTTKLL
jgi:hypothetical protein